MLNIAKEDTLFLLLGGDRHQINRAANNPNIFYSIRKIKKANGGIRIIESPNKFLKQVQKKILTLIKRHPLSECAYGSVKGRSNKDNAFAHRNGALVFQSDLCSFYPSVRHDMVHSIFLELLGCAPSIARTLTQLTTYDGHLPTGAPTSPYLANLIMLETDARLEGLANQYRLVYTRYMDDVAFSGKHIPDRFLNSFYDIMRCSGFTIHYGKTGISAKNSPQVITGIGTNTGRLKIPSKYKAKLRAIEKASADGTIPKKLAKKRIQGMREYIKYVECS